MVGYDTPIPHHYKYIAHSAASTKRLFLLLLHPINQSMLKMRRNLIRGFGGIVECKDVVHQIMKLAM
jgi:hypothetical protein